MRNPPTPLSPREQDGLDNLEEYLEFEQPFTQETATGELVNRGFHRDEAEQVIDQLLLKGYLYEVNDQLHFTE